MSRWIGVLLLSAWVLWAVRAESPGEREWAPLTGFETWQACIDARNGFSSIIEQAQEEGKRVEVYGVGEIRDIKCFPAQLDPRQPR